MMTDRELLWVIIAAFFRRIKRRWMLFILLVGTAIFLCVLLLRMSLVLATSIVAIILIPISGSYRILKPRWASFRGVKNKHWVLQLNFSARSVKNYIELLIDSGVMWRAIFYKATWSIALCIFFRKWCINYLLLIAEDTTSLWKSLRFLLLQWF